MQKVVVFLAVLFSNLILSQTNVEEPKKVVDDFFVSFHAKDSVALQKVCHVDMALQKTTQWHLAYCKKSNMQQVCDSQITSYFS